VPRRSIRLLLHAQAFYPFRLLQAVVLEVGNTPWDEQHLYVIGEGSADVLPVTGQRDETSEGVQLSFTKSRLVPKREIHAHCNMNFDCRVVRPVPLEQRLPRVSVYAPQPAVHLEVYCAR
jgi:hypothetical protein